MKLRDRLIYWIGSKISDQQIMYVNILIDVFWFWYLHGVTSNIKLGYYYIAIVDLQAMRVGPGTVNIFVRKKFKQLLLIILAIESDLKQGPRTIKDP